jgi:NTP pyrophosphatase (non-canonical NTP hydrolase)
VTLQERMAALAAHIIAIDPDRDPASLRERQVAALVDEAGELLHEVRRVYANTRTRGSLAEIAAEAADVVLAAQVMAHVFGVKPPTLPRSGRPGLVLVEPAQVSAARWVVQRAAGIEPYHEAPVVARQLRDVAGAVLVVTGVCGFDLAAAVEAKLVVIEERLGVPR